MQTCLEKRNIPRRESVCIKGLEGINVQLVNNVLRGLAGLLNAQIENEPTRIIPTVKPSIQTTPYQKRLEEYGELLSVKDLTEIFKCVPRTITNWERGGILVNVAETSTEVNKNGNKKRGKEKRYRRDTVSQSIKLQEKFNANR